MTCPTVDDDGLSILALDGPWVQAPEAKEVEAADSSAQGPGPGADATHVIGPKTEQCLASSAVVLLYVRKNHFEGLSGTGSPGRPPRPSHSS